MAEPSLDLLVHDCSLVDVVRRQVRTHQDLGVRGRDLVAIGETGQVGTARRVVDGAGYLALPGLVNCHAHLAMGIFRATSELRPLQRWLAWVLSVEACCEPEDVYWGALLSLCQMLRGGVTTVADMYSPESVVARAVELAGIRGYLSESVSLGDKARRGAVEAQVRRAEELVLRWNGAAEGRISTGIAPHSVYACDEGLLRELAALGRRLRVGMHVHVAETRLEVEQCLARLGRRPPRVLADCGVFQGPALAAHSVHLDKDDIALYAELGVGVAHNPGSNLKLGSGLAPAPALRRAGVHVGLGTDGAGSNDRLDLWRDCYLAAVLHEWDEEEAGAWPALEMATVGGAAALGMADKVGRLEPGYRADVVLVDAAALEPATDPALALVYAGRGDEVNTVIVDGRVVVEDRRLLTLDEEEVRRQCRLRAVRLFAGRVPT
jgi:5-methylthioadenosine/S-adenosylhomocysteine deaminase